MVVNLYPFAKAAQNPETPFDALVEEIDIGGPSLVRAAAKNFRDVLVVVDPADYPQVLDQLARPGGPEPAFRFKLMQKAFAHTGMYDGMIAVTLHSVDFADGAMIRQAPPSVSDLAAKDLRYGENPHQKATWTPSPFLPRWQIHQGKELSYTNLLDLDAALRIALEFPEPVGVVIKHTNPCGVALGATVTEAYVRAREADPLSAFGGIVGLNRTLDAETARALTSTFIEAVIAPAVADEAKPILATKANLRVATTDFARLSSLDNDSDHERDARTFLGGTLTQDRDVVAEARAPWPHDEYPEGRDQACTDSRGVERAAIRVAGLRSREVERRDLYRRRPYAGCRRGTDEPRRRRQGRRHEGGRRTRRIGRRVRRVLPVPRRARRRRRRRRDRRRAARRFGPRRRSDRRGGRARAGDGVHGQEAL